MTKKVSKKNLLCLFPLKATKSKGQAHNKSIRSTKELAKDSKWNAAELECPPTPGSTSNWEAHYNYLEIVGWGSGLFGAPMDKEAEVIALRAVQLAIESGDKFKIAKSYRHLFYLYSEFNHPNSLPTGIKSVAAALSAYGPSTAEVGDEVCMLAWVYEVNNKYDLAIAARDASIKIFEKGGTTDRLFEALENAIGSASDMGRGDKAEEYARHGIRLVKKRCKKGSYEYKDSMEYFEEMLATAHDPPLPIEEQRRQLLEMFPKLKKVVKDKLQELKVH